MIYGSHVIISAYGFWLPNDPRGSWSDFVGAWELLRFGAATKTDDPRSVARKPHNVAIRLAAKQALMYPAVRSSGPQARAVGNGFAKLVREDGLKVWACAIMPEHVHLVIARHRHSVERIVNLLKGFATRRLIEKKLHPLAKYQDADGQVPKCWARREWKVFIDNEAHLLQAIRYVENNPLKEGKPRQKWSFVTAYRGLV